MNTNVTAAQFESFMNFMSAGVVELVRNTAAAAGEKTDSQKSLLDAIAKYTADDFEWAARLSTQMPIFCPAEAAKMDATHAELAKDDPEVILPKSFR